MPRELNTTSYAILGWLAVKPWPIYELAKQTRRNLRFFWPRADSRLYDEPKNLVAHGLAKAERTFVGKRPRTIYAITAKGRRALEQWLAQPSSLPSLEFEALVRVFFAQAGTRDQLSQTLDGADALATEIMRAGMVVATEFIEGRHPFPERVHLSGLVFDFLWSWAELLQRWTRDSRAEVAGWKELGPEGKQRRALELFERTLSRGTPGSARRGSGPRAPRASAPPRTRRP